MTRRIEVRPRSARRARISLTLATLVLGLLCLTASGFAPKASADERPALPEGWNQFGGAWEGNLPVFPAWADEQQIVSKNLLPPRISINVVDGKPQVLLVRYRLQVNWDGSVRYVPVGQTTSWAEVRGERLSFRIQRDNFESPNGEPGSVDTEWELELSAEGHGTLSSIGSDGHNSILEVRRFSLDPNMKVGC